MNSEEAWSVVLKASSGRQGDVTGLPGSAAGMEHMSFRQAASVFVRTHRSRMARFSEDNLRKSGAHALVAALGELGEQEVLVHTFASAEWLAYALELPVTGTAVGTWLLRMQDGKVQFT